MTRRIVCTKRSLEYNQVPSGNWVCGIQGVHIKIGSGETIRSLRTLVYRRCVDVEVQGPE